LPGCLYARDADARRLFPPRYATEAQAQAALLNVVRRDPAQFGYAASRWTLAQLAQTCDWLTTTTLGGLSQRLKRLDIRYKHGRSYVHSPDPFYDEKVSYLTLCRMRAWYAPDRYVLVYLDEVSYGRQPTVAWDYEQRGHHQPFARRSYHRDTEFRGIGALNAVTGQVIYRQASKIKLPFLSNFYALLHQTYPHAETLYVVQDNWPVHVHPDIVARLEPQRSPFWPTVPANWPTQPHRRAVREQLPIQLVFLPTYASWLNPIEKLWRWLRQEILHLHRLADDWPALKARVWTFFQQFADGSPALLRYVGLLSV
jgi:transposase